MDNFRWELSRDVASDPVSLAEAYLQERLYPSDRNAIDLAIRDNGGFRMTKEDWCKYGDRKNLCRRIERAWISRSASPLDITAMEISSIAGFEVTPEDLISHAMEFQDGKSWEYISPRAHEIRERFDLLSLGRLNCRVAKSIVEKSIRLNREQGDCSF